MSPARPRREEVRVAADDLSARRDLHRRGFLLEGRLRAARRAGDHYVDELIYGRLADDPVGREAHTWVMNSVTARKRLIAHALVTDAAGRVLLCETSFKPDWELPGGIVEPGESPLYAVAREMVEELGFAPQVDRVLVVDWLQPYLGWEDALELVFATRPMTDEQAAALEPDGHEIVGLHWLERDHAADHMTPFGAGRLRAAYLAVDEGHTLYTEAGRLVE